MQRSRSKEIKMLRLRIHSNGLSIYEYTMNFELSRVSEKWLGAGYRPSFFFEFNFK